MRKTIAQHAWDVYIESWVDLDPDFKDTPPIIAWGDLGLLGEIADRANLKQSHPLNRQAAVLKALRKSKLFKRVILRRLGGYRGGAAYNVGYELIVNKEELRERYKR